MDLPLGYKVPNQNRVCKLNRSIYGLRQASRQWFTKFSTALINVGFTQSKCDYSLFTTGSGNAFVALLVYVDDIIITSPSPAIVQQVQHNLQKLFKLKILGDLRYFLGLEIARFNKGIYLSQRKYVLSLLDDTGFIDAKPTSLPMDPNLKLSSMDGEFLSDASQYRRIIGRLLYLTISRPDISFAVNKLSQCMAAPRTSHLDATHHLLRYLKSTPGNGLLFPANSSLSLKVYADSDWGNCPATHRTYAHY